MEYRAEKENDTCLECALYTKCNKIDYDQMINGQKLNCNDGYIWKEIEEKDIKLDFSGISKEKLLKAVKGIWGMCEDIDCRNCPLRQSSDGCDVDGHKVIRLFKEELNRREKDMNEMPELKAGMIVEMDTKFSITRHCVLIPTNKGLTLITKEWCRFGDLDTSKILKIYNNDSSNFNALHERNDFCNLDLIWSRKSDNDIKIEELKQSIKDMEDNHSKSVADIKEKIEELKR